MRRRALFSRLKCDSIPDIPRPTAGESIFRDSAKKREMPASSILRDTFSSPFRAYPHMGA